VFIITPYTTQIGDKMKNLINRYKFQSTDFYDLEWELKEQMGNLDKVRDIVTISKNCSFIETDYLDNLMEQVSKDYEYSKKILNDDYQGVLSSIRAKDFNAVINNELGDDETEYTYSLFDKTEDEYSYHWELCHSYDYYFVSHNEDLAEGQKKFEENYELISLDVYKETPKNPNDFESTRVICLVKDKSTDKKHVVTDLARFAISLGYDTKVDDPIKYIDFKNHVAGAKEFFNLSKEDILNLSI
jgi:hypothetical protein